MGLRAGMWRRYGACRGEPSDGRCTPTFLKPSHSSYLHSYEDGTECSETSAYKIQTRKYPEESIPHSEHGESLKSRKRATFSEDCQGSYKVTRASLRACKGTSPLMWPPNCTEVCIRSRCNAALQHAFVKVFVCTGSLTLPCRLGLKSDGTLRETGFRLLAKRTSPFKSAGGRQFSRLLAAELCASAVVMLNTPCSEVVWRILATHSIRRFPLHFLFRASPCAITFQLDSNSIQTATQKYGAYLHIAFFPPQQKDIALRKSGR